MPERLRSRVASAARLGVAVVLTGVAAGLAGAALTGLLHLVQHLAFGYTEDSFLVGVERSPSWRRVVAPAVVGLLVGLLWWWSERAGPREDVSVTAALRGGGGTRLPVLRTALDGALQIVAVGGGASLGREGAPRQVGAALAGWVSHRLALPPRSGRTLLACGAGAGLAAVYDVPVAGALFTLEVLLASWTLVDVVPAALTSVLATLAARPFLGDAPTYAVTGLHPSWSLVVAALVLGPLAGLLGVGFVHLTTRARTGSPRGARRVLAVTLTFGALGCVATFVPAVLGNGRGPAGLALAGSLGLVAAVVLTALKPVATAACLRSGAVGGLLTPALATGATAGVAVGLLWDRLWPGTPVADFAVVGAAALVAVTQRAPLTALALVPELVGGGLGLAGPLVVAVLTASAVATRVDGGLAPHALRAARARRASRRVSRRGSSRPPAPTRHDGAG